MKKLILLLSLIIVSCSSSDEYESAESPVIEYITYMILTNENTGGAAQKA